MRRDSETLAWAAIAHGHPFGAPKTGRAPIAIGALPFILWFASQRAYLLNAQSSSIQATMATRQSLVIRKLEVGCQLRSLGAE